MSGVEPDGESALDGLAAPAGWYPDPKGSGNLFYWDGAKWTGQVRGVEGSTSLQRSLGSDRWLVLGGGAALAVSPFLTWVKVLLLGNLSLFQLFNAAGRSNGWAWAAVVAGGVASVVALKERDSSVLRGTGLGVGLLGGVLAAYALVGLRNELRDAHGLAAIGIGPYVALAGCGVMVVGALMSKRSNRVSG